MITFDFKTFISIKGEVLFHFSLSLLKMVIQKKNIILKTKYSHAGLWDKAGSTVWETYFQSEDRSKDKQLAPVFKPPHPLRDLQRKRVSL